VKFSRQPDPDTQDQHIADVSAASAIMLCSGQGWQGLVLTYLKLDFDSWFLKKPGKTEFSGRQNRRTTTDSQQGPDFAKHYKAGYVNSVGASGIRVARPESKVNWTDFHQVQQSGSGRSGLRHLRQT
jgi:hypothetical protein